ncbi:MAG TPA: hypothetical protein VFQ61_14085 [Polyangiaceae bacterium]|nr:hypothetical protein [Polyangiaceae bacterium]
MIELRGELAGGLAEENTTGHGLYDFRVAGQNGLMPFGPLRIEALKSPIGVKSGNTIGVFEEGFEDWDRIGLSGERER